MKYKESLSARQVNDYHRDGYLVVKNFLRAEETWRLYSIATEDQQVNRHAFDLTDKEGKKTKLSLWYIPGDDSYGLLTRSESIVGACNQLLEGNTAVCHFHSKLMQKEPKLGGAWEWHQDYGYWYKNEFLFPDQMISVMLAITKANKENGCLQVVRGSHKMGRIEHGFSGEQVGASQRYVDLILQDHELVYVELEPGDALFFHSNLLHRSAANNSDHPRWSLISCYNRAGNKPHNEPSGSSTIPIRLVPDQAMMETEARGLQDSSNFLKKDEDQALK